MGQFVPLWTSILRSRKVAALPDDLYRTWTQCLLTAQEYDHLHGSLPNIDDFSYALHMEPKSLMSRLSRLVTLHFIDLHDGIYYVHDWDDWRHRPDPTSAARKRAQRDREKQAAIEDALRNGDEHPSEDVTVTPVTSVTSQMSQCHAPTQLNSTQLNSSSSAREDDDDDDVLIFGRKTMGDRFDLEHIGEKVVGWRAASYPDSWIRDAILVANCNAKPGKCPAYITTCLRQWLARGGPDPAVLVKAQVQSAGMPSGGQNGSSNTVTPSQRLKDEPKKPPSAAEVDEWQKDLAALKAKRRQDDFDRARIVAIEQELAKR